MAAFNPVTHVIFDLDGLLLDSEPIYHNAQSRILMMYGHEFTHEMRLKLMGRTEIDVSRMFVAELNLPLTPEEFMAKQTEEVSREMPQVQLMPGAERLIKHFHLHGVPIAVATSSSRIHCDLKFQNHQSLFSLMHHLVSGTSDSEVKQGKPAPDIFLICASKFPDNPPPEKVLVFEDAPNGVIAAVSAGMQVVMVPEDHIPQEKRAAATLVISSLEKFQPELFGLPPFNNEVLVYSVETSGTSPLKLRHQNAPSESNVTEETKQDSTESLREAKLASTKSLGVAKQASSKLLEEAKQDTAKSLGEAKQATTKKFEETKQATAKKFEEAKQATAKKFEEAKQDTAKSLGEAKQATTKKFEEAKQATAKKFEEAKQDIAKSVGETKQAAAQTFEEVKQATTKSLGKAKQANTESSEEVSEASTESTKSQDASKT